jgi:hypothetical protein
MHWPWQGILIEGDGSLQFTSLTLKGPFFIKLFTAVSYEFSYKARVFVLASLFGLV